MKRWVPVLESARGTAQPARAAEAREEGRYTHSCRPSPPASYPPSLPLPPLWTLLLQALYFAGLADILKDEARPVEMRQLTGIMLKNALSATVSLGCCCSRRGAGHGRVGQRHQGMGGVRDA